MTLTPKQREAELRRQLLAAYAEAEFRAKDALLHIGDNGIPTTPWRFALDRANEAVKTAERDFLDCVKESAK